MANMEAALAVYQADVSQEAALSVYQADMYWAPQLSEDYLKYHNTAFNAYDSTAYDNAYYNGFEYETHDAVDYYGSFDKCNFKADDVEDVKSTRGDGTNTPTLSSGGSTSNVQPSSEGCPSRRTSTSQPASEIQWVLCSGTAEEIKAMSTAGHVICMPTPLSAAPAPFVAVGSAEPETGSSVTVVGASSDVPEVAQPISSSAVSISDVVKVSQRTWWADVTDEVDSVCGESFFDADGTTLQSPSEAEFIVTVGGELHNLGQCRPCRFFHSKVGCHNGETCEGCHQQHEKVSRPSKSRRKKCKRMLQGLDEVAIDGDDFKTIVSELFGTSEYMNTQLINKMRKDPRIDPAMPSQLLATCV